MNNSQNRRALLKKLSLLSVGGIIGIDTQANQITGSIIKHEQGEVLYIGETRKAKLTIKISKTSDFTPEISLISEVISAGDGIPEHKHLNEDEFLFVQQGKVQAKVNDQVEELNSGDLVYVPRGDWHGFDNKSKEDVILFFGYSPAGFEDYFRAIGTANMHESLGFSKEDWIKTNRKYGVVYR